MKDLNNQAQEPDPNNPNAGGEPGGNAIGQPEAKSYTQDELDTMFAQRASRASQQATSEILKLLGVENLDAAKTLIQKQTEADEAAKTELEKAQEAAHKALEAQKQAELAREQALAEAREKLMRAAVREEALKQGFRPEAANDVWMLVDRTKITENAQGDFDNIAQAVEQVAKERPYWLGSSDRPSSGNGTPRPNIGRPRPKPETSSDQTRQSRPFRL